MDKGTGVPQSWLGVWELGVGEPGLLACMDPANPVLVHTSTRSAR